MKWKSNKKTNSLFSSLYRTIGLVFQVAASDIWRLIVINLIFGSGPVFILYLSKLVIDETSRLATVHSGTNFMNLLLTNKVLLWSIFLFIIINILLDSAETINGFIFSKLKDRLVGGIKELIFKKVSEFDDISLFENPKLLNTLYLARDNIPKLTQLANVIVNLLTGIFAFIPVVILSFSIGWWVPLLIIMTAIPSIYKQLHYESLTWGVEEAQADLVKQMSINERVLTGEEYAKELRQYKLQDFLLKRWKGLFVQAFQQLQKVRKKGTYAILGWSLISGIGVGIPYVYVVYMAIQGSFSLGDLALFAGLVYQVRRSLFILVGNLTDIQGIALASTTVFKLLDLETTLKIQENDGKFVRDMNNQGLDFSNVSFSYPGNQEKVLNNINLTINHGEMVVIVGENGAGKTTLSKLISRLYDPSEGTIKWNGVDIKQLPLDDLREKIAVVNQDYARFPTSARENIAFGSLSHLQEDEIILGAAEGAGLKNVLERLDDGLDTPLSKQLDNGIDLSGGQWQRISIARALIREVQSEILLLDEPTASLDPNTEHEIFHILSEMAKDKIAIVISHRLALARKADKVVVMEKGEIVEIGSHEELMKKEGLYYALFTRQASSYF